jgi:hypothetical protein
VDDSVRPGGIKRSANRSHIPNITRRNKPGQSSFVTARDSGDVRLERGDSSPEVAAEPGDEDIHRPNILSDNHIFSLASGFLGTCGP